MQAPDPNCVLCDQKKGVAVKTVGALEEQTNVDCPNCGPYAISDKGIQLVRYKLASERYKVSAYNRYQLLAGIEATRLFYYTERPASSQPYHRVIEETIANWWPPRLRDRLDYVLLNISRKNGERLGHVVSIDSSDTAICLAKDWEGAIFSLELLKQAGLIEFNRGSGAPFRVVLTLEGHERAYELEKGVTGRQSKTVFVAMSFDPSLNEVYENAIKPAIAACGYDALRVDREEHSDKICDKIEAEIRRSRFVVADFTHNKPGVYYEAGLARGLGLHVIWSVKDGDDLKNLHFDTRQYNHIAWKTSEDLKEHLETRIRALGV